MTLTLFCFSRNLSWICQCRIDHSKKVMTKRLTKRWLLKCHQASIDSTNCLSISFDYHNWVRNADIYFVSIRILYDINSVILRHWWLVKSAAFANDLVDSFAYFASKICWIIADLCLVQWIVFVHFAATANALTLELLLELTGMTSGFEIAILHPLWIYNDLMLRINAYTFYCKTNKSKPATPERKRFVHATK